MSKFKVTEMYLSIYLFWYGLDDLYKLKVTISIVNGFLCIHITSLLSYFNVLRCWLFILHFSLRKRRCSSVGTIPVMPRQRKFSAVCTCSGDIVVTRWEFSIHDSCHVLCQAGFWGFIPFVDWKGLVKTAKVFSLCSLSFYYFVVPAIFLFWHQGFLFYANILVHTVLSLFRSSYFLVQLFVLDINLCRCFTVFFDQQ